MLETIDLSCTLEKETYKEWFDTLQEDLFLLQRKAFESGMPTIIIFEGWDSAGKGDSIMKLVGRLDPRGYKVFRTGPPNDEERLRPFLWRFWLKLPARGGMNIFDRSWYSRVLGDRLDGNVKQREWQQAYQEINQFERQLVDDGNVVVKFFLHISRKEQAKRFKQMEKSETESWRVSKDNWKRLEHYDEYATMVDEMLERTSTSYAPWTVVEATDRRFRRVKIFRTVIQAMEEGLQRKAEADARKVAYKAEFSAERKKKEAARAASVNAAPAPAVEGEAPPNGVVPIVATDQMPSILDRSDLALALDRDAYNAELEKAQKRIRELEFLIYGHRIPVMIGYEGWDAGGKGGNIRRVIENLDPRGYEVIPIAAPKGDEATHHYLWRFWRAIPKAGHIAIFDRTWYGRVLVERVEGFCTRDEYRRAFQEINEFEQSLVNYGAVVVKFWLHLSKEEQLRRFEARQANPEKQYKITEEDWRNREKWDDYNEAVTEMIERTSTSYAPWTIVEGEDKLWARIRALTTIIDAVEDALGHQGNGKK